MTIDDTVNEEVVGVVPFRATLVLSFTATATIDKHLVENVIGNVPVIAVLPLALTVVPLPHCN